MSKVPCIFCNQNASLSKEHLWPKWLIRQMNECSSTVGGTYYNIDGTVKNYRKQSIESLVYGKICAKCNNGWLSQIESKVKPIIINLLSSANSICKITISKEEAETLAIWAFKTAIIRNIATDYKKIVPSSHFQFLYREQQIPSNIYIDIGLCPSHFGLTGLQSQCIYGLLSKNENYLVETLKDCTYNITLAIGALLLRTIYLPLNDYWLFPNGLRGDNSRRLHPVTNRIKLDFSLICSDIYEFESSPYFNRLTK